MTTLTGHDAIAHAARTGAPLRKHADPVDGARTITLDEAREIAREDAGLVWCEVPDARPVFAVRLDSATGLVREGFERLDGTASTRDGAIEVARAAGLAVVTDLGEGGLIEVTPGEVVGEERDVWTVTVEA